MRLASSRIARGDAREERADGGEGMNVILSRRDFLQSGAALVVAFAWPTSSGAQVVAGADRVLGKPLDPKEVDGFLAIHSDSSVTLYCGKVDLGQGLRIA